MNNNNKKTPTTTKTKNKPTNPTTFSNILNCLKKTKN
jgi:hypothetical protein